MRLLKIKLNNCRFSSLVFHNDIFMFLGYVLKYFLVVITNWIFNKIVIIFIYLLNCMSLLFKFFKENNSKIKIECLKTRENWSKSEIEISQTALTDIFILLGKRTRRKSRTNFQKSLKTVRIISTLFFREKNNENFLHWIIQKFVDGFAEFWS